MVYGPTATRLVHGMAIVALTSITFFFGIKLSSIPQFNTCLVAAKKPFKFLHDLLPSLFQLFQLRYITLRMHTRGRTNIKGACKQIQSTADMQYFESVYMEN